MTQQQRDIKRKLAVLRHAEESGNVALTARRFGIWRQCYYTWERAYEERGEEGLVNKKPCPENVTLRTPPEVAERIVHLRRTCHFGPMRIAWHPERYCGISISSNGVYRVLKRVGLSRLPANCRKRSMVSLRYETKVPGHHLQLDVKSLQFKGKDGRRLKRYPFTAIDDATRIRALRIYERHHEQSAVDLIDYVAERFPFRIHTVRTDNGHERQAKSHWHCEDLGMHHVYIKAGRPNLNGKVERSHLTDQLEFYQLLDYTRDVDLRARLSVWEEFYNLQRPHAAHGGKTPYEVLREKLLS
jgi:transposase InsO family protein